MQTNPAPAPAPSNETNTRCYAVGNTLNCSQRPIDNQPIGAPLYEMQRKRMINSMTEECMARQGWTKETVSQTTNTTQHQSNASSEINTTTYVRNRQIGSACIDDAQCIDGVCIVADNSDIRQCEADRRYKERANLNNSKSFNMDRAEGSACVYDEQCIHGMKCTNALYETHKKCTPVR